MASARYIVGIDLGTTNSAVAYVDTAEAARRIVSFPVTQLVGEATVAERPTLPSFLYVGGEHDVFHWARNGASARYAKRESSGETGHQLPSLGHCSTPYRFCRLGCPEQTGRAEARFPPRKLWSGRRKVEVSTVLPCLWWRVGFGG